MSDVDKAYKEAARRAKAPGPDPKLGDNGGLCRWRMVARHARRATMRLLAHKTALSARHGRLTLRYGAMLAPVLLALVVALLAPVSGAAQTTPGTYEPTPGLEPEPPILAPVARSSDLYLPVILAPVRTVIGEPVLPVTPTPTLVEVTMVSTSTPTATPTSTPYPPGTPFPVTPPPLVDVPLLEFSNAAVGGVWTHVAVCNHTAGTVQATVSVSVTLAAGGAELHEWPNAPTEVGSGDCAHLYAILPTDGAAERMSAAVTY